MSKKSYRYKKHLYVQINNEIEEPRFDVIHNESKPKRLYKYFGLNKNSADALLNSYLFASHPFHLNDIMDCNPLLTYSSKKIAIDIYKKFIKNTSDKELNRFRDEDVHNRQFINLMWSLLSNVYGVVSLTGRKNHSLMWPHYTNEDGFQIGFDFNLLEKSLAFKVGNGSILGIYPINYVKKLEPIDIYEFIPKFLGVPFLYLTNLKNKKWKYEMEWRIIASNKHMGVPFNESGLTTFKEETNSEFTNSRFLYYSKEAISEVTLGHKFFNNKYFNIDYRGARLDIKFKNFKKGNKDNKEDLRLLYELFDFMVENFADKLYYSTFKYSGTDSNPKLIRSKEGMKINKIAMGHYCWNRTKNVIELG